jgi:uncharacterized membrane protein YphA (DoxX/SURF4 family)
MTLIRRIARPMLASMFVAGGFDALQDPAAKVGTAEPIALPVARRISWLTEDTEDLVRINGAVQVAAGCMLAAGILPRLSAMALAASIVPTTAAGHRFWEEEEPDLRKQQRTHFLKNVGLLGGLLLAVVDTEAKPGVMWRTKHGVGDARRAVRAQSRNARARLEIGELRTRAKVSDLLPS